MVRRPTQHTTIHGPVRESPVKRARLESPLCLLDADTDDTGYTTEESNEESYSVYTDSE